MSGTIRGTWHDDPAHFRKSTRRGFLQVGVVGALGLTLGDYFRLTARADDESRNGPSKEGAAKSVIHIYMPGGMAHQESWDPKPNAPIEYRGEMASIKTKLDGVYINECLKQTAQIADKITICRSMTHGEAAHERGTHNMFTGYRPSPALVYPSFGSVISHEFGPKNNLPPYVCVPSQPTNFAGPGYLSSSFAPFSLGADPANGNFQVQDLALPAGVDDKRFTSRKNMLEAVNEHFAQKEKSDNLDAMDTFYQRAYALISSQKAREAFDINKEPPAIRDEYGRHAAGQRMLLARRLVESGVRFVSLTYGGWDLHGGIKGGTQSQLPQFDQAFASLIRDLDRRGLLDSTVVMVSSEFGRTPKINATAGRDHWPKVFSIVLAGGGFKKGMVYGTSDPTASEPEDDPLVLDDLSFTLYNQLGIRGDKRLMSPGNRPQRIVDSGKVLKAMLEKA
ncbi:MAG TPA: DUF1501 domain-containing protein [Gemmataceae bacterium]|jgi:hypothetical protein|nr:DUF1501 domain-containing protein [Gemmataceae bacterium]